MKIALDIMSGDKAPNCNINGAINFVRNPISDNNHVVLYGTLPSINSVLYAVFSISIICVIGYSIFRKYQARIAEEM